MRKDKDGSGGPPAGPRVRVCDEEALGDGGSELVAGLGGREHGPLELHLSPAFGDLHRRRRGHGLGRVLSALSGQKRGVRGRGVSAAGGATPAAAASVSYYNLHLLHAHHPHRIRWYCCCCDAAVPGARARVLMLHIFSFRFQSALWAVSQTLVSCLARQHSQASY